MAATRRPEMQGSPRFLCKHGWAVEGRKGEEVQVCFIRGEN
jgi:hypothetical protein